MFILITDQNMLLLLIYLLFLNTPWQTVISYRTCRPILRNYQNIYQWNLDVQSQHIWLNLLTIFDSGKVDSTLHKYDSGFPCCATILLTDFDMWVKKWNVRGNKII